MNLNETENKIIEMINKIRDEQRKRPSFPVIFEGMNKNIDELNKIDISVFTEAMTKLQSENVIFDGGKGGKESYYINDPSKKDTNSVNKDTLNIDSSFSGEDSNIYSYVNDKFHETLINMIKLEVKNEFKSINNEHSLSPKPITHINYTDNPIITTLQSEVEFLRKELLSKDKVIELLIKDKRTSNNNSINCSDNDASFVHPKNSIKLKQNPDDNSYKINTENRFQILNTTPLTECDNINVSVNSTNNKTKRKKYRSTTIIGDSVIKDIKAQKMKKNIPKGEKIFIKSFPGATTECMVDYIKPSLKYNPDLIILHTGVNDLRSKKSANVIADNIVNLACEVKTFSNDVVISGLIERNDDLNFKGRQVNELLIVKCMEKKLLYIDNGNINGRQHLSNDGLHLNYKGTFELANNFLDCIDL